jgi:histone acetyltransferase
LQNEPSAWPFLRPVDGAVVHDYYDVITNPMGESGYFTVSTLRLRPLTPSPDLSTMESKLENNHYNSIDDFISDAQLIFENCRQYNGEKSTYTNQANKLEKALDRILKKRQTAL